MFTGKVVHGEARGRKLGFPTANLDTLINKTRLRDGVYASIVTLKEQKYIGALAIKNKEDRVEIFLVGYEGDEFYGENMTVDPLALTSSRKPRKTRRLWIVPRVEPSISLR